MECGSGSYIELIYSFIASVINSLLYMGETSLVALRVGSTYIAEVDWGKPTFPVL
jgi:hypothetical protein